MGEETLHYIGSIKTILRKLSCQIIQWIFEIKTHKTVGANDESLRARNCSLVAHMAVTHIFENVIKILNTRPCVIEFIASRLGMEVKGMKATKEVGGAQRVEANWISVH